MGTLGNSIFRTMLGWIRTLSVQIWNSVTAPEGETLLQWIGEHWKSLAIGLCLAGLLIDLAVYLFRWQPYRAWQGFFQRKGRLPESPFQEELDEEEMPAEDDPNFRFDQRYETESEMNTAERSFPPEERMAAAETEGFAGTEAWETGEPGGTEAWAGEEDSTTAAFEQAIMPRRRRRVTRLLREGEEETLPPEQVIDQYAAYRRPVYPRSWKNDEEEAE